MSDMQMAAIAAIEEQQRGHNHDTVWMVGEQLKDICRREEHSAELIATDLKENKAMSIVAAEKKIAERARKNKVGNCGCVSPYEAEEILRKFYGLGEPGETEPVQDEAGDSKIIDLADFLI